MTFWDSPSNCAGFAAPFTLGGRNVDGPAASVVIGLSTAHARWLRPPLGLANVGVDMAREEASCRP